MSGGRYTKNEELRDYVVERPTRGVQILTVRARNAEEALELADTEGEGFDHNVEWTGKGRAWLDKQR